MLNSVKNRLERSEAVISSSLKVGDTAISSEQEEYAVLFFRLCTDDTENRLKNYQPEVSTIVIEDGEIVEFDVRLGSWSPEDHEEEISKLEEAARKASREHYVPIWRVDSGGGFGFVPHIRMTEGNAHPDAFIGFIENIAKEVEFLSSVSKS